MEGRLCQLDLLWSAGRSTFSETEIIRICPSSPILQKSEVFNINMFMHRNESELEISREADIKNDAAFFITVFVVALLGISVLREEIAYGIAKLNTLRLKGKSHHMGKIQISGFDAACLRMVERRKDLSR